MTNEILFYLISACLFFAIFKIAMGIFFVKKDILKIFSFLIWSIYCLLDIMAANFIMKPFVLIFWEIVSSFCLCMLLYHGSVKKKLMWIAIINLIGMISETIVGYTYIFMNIQFRQLNVLGSFVSKIVLLMIVILVKILNHSRLKRDIPFPYWCILFVIPIGSIVVLNTLFSLCENSEDKNAPIYALISSAFILGINFILLYLYEHLLDRLEVQKQQIVFNKQVELCKNQIFEREESNLNIRNIKHDIENHLICIREYMERKDLEYAKKYVEDLLKDNNYIANNGYIDSGNIVIDSLLNYKNRIMEQLKIKMYTHIEIPYELKFSDADICVILSNCLDNSIEAVDKIFDERRKIVNVEIIYRKNSLLMKISNPYNGIVKKDKLGNYVTTKDDAQNHGIGLDSVRKAVQKYDGLVDITANDNIFIVQVLLYVPRKNYI